MINNINIHLIEFSINSLLRQKSKNIFIFLVFSTLIFLLSSVIFISGSIKFELNSIVDSLPEIIIQEIQAGRHKNIEVKKVDEILEIEGVVRAEARVWGYYYFKNAGVNFSVIGVDMFEPQWTKELQKIADEVDFTKLEENLSMIVGRGVGVTMVQNYYSDYFNFITPDGNFKKIKIAGVFKSQSNLESNDMILLSKPIALEILGIEEDEATDIVVTVANPAEIPMIRAKLNLLFPNCRVVTKDDLKVSYQNIFDYKSGIFLALFIICFFTFFIIIYDKASGLTSSQRKEIGILKAIGWRVDDILKEKFYEAFIISFTSFLIGILSSFFFIFFLQAPLLRDIFIGYSQLKPTFDLPFIFDYQTIFLLFFLTVPIYLSATIIPSWRASTLDADEVMR